MLLNLLLLLEVNVALEAVGEEGRSEGMALG